MPEELEDPEKLEDLEQPGRAAQVDLPEQAEPEEGPPAPAQGTEQPVAEGPAEQAEPEEGPPVPAQGTEQPVAEGPAEQAEPEEGPPEPAQEPAQLVEIGLSEVRLSVVLRPGQEAGLVVLAEMEEPFRSLNIYVGQPEAKAIRAGWHGGRPARPGTWDLLLQAVELLGGRLDKVVIDRVEEARHFFATLEFQQGGQILKLACRPSDAVALAVRVAAAGMYATEEVLAAAGQYP